MRPPDFWKTDNPLARLLSPLGALTGAITVKRATSGAAYRADAPVICVGNLSMGGTGKTPVAADIAARLKANGRKPAILMRGYGGNITAPTQVDPFIHTAIDVGDEALVHAARMTTWVARKRSLAALEATKAGANALVMDDGHQHASLKKDLSIIVVDGRAGFGNGRCVPAGPLREPIEGGLARAQAAVIMGDDPLKLAHRLAPYLTVLRARLVPGPEQNLLRGQRVVAFAGIGEPMKFFETLHNVGAQLLNVHPFDDHFDFTVADIQPILDEAFSLNAIPVTTAKDAARLSPDQRQQVNVLSIGVEWEDPAALERLLDKLF